MIDNELQRIVDALAESLGRSVAINDPTIHLLCASRHFGDEDAVRVHAVLQRDAGSAVIGYLLAQGVTRWTEPGVIPARPDLRLQARLCAPVRWRGVLLALLMVIDPDRSLTSDQLNRVQDAVAAMAAVLYREFLVADRHRAARETALRKVLSGSEKQRKKALESLKEGQRVRTAPSVTVSVFDVWDEADTETAEIELALRASMETLARPDPAAAAYFVKDCRAVLLQLGDKEPDQDQLHRQATAVAQQVQDAVVGGARCVVGIGDPCADLDQAWVSYEHAAIATRAARMLPGFEGVAQWAELGAYAPLLQIPAKRLTPNLVPAPLRALIAQDSHNRLVQTLAVYLDHAGSSPQAAAALHIHRTSLYYRLRQIEEITGLDLTRGDDRLNLHVGLCVLTLLEGVK
ncbi:helix-turn-helix domain-containing protein [Streptomyces phaeochromogenes]|uniref:PucR family transcriptional regulator n=1 Tax=Streptomyces phaeochromogenes TaxID=1923 RepID=UPI002DD92492|nr:helix-turn-helix domain-containing protein [Streptomyces phaeochromogenes]WRZ34585.1 helix-turn-helix domain-containing protein [Streptomyces phaeochromogenes]